MERQVVIVTGAAVGIGRAIAIAFGKRGASVIVNCSRSTEDACETVRLVKEAGGDGHVFQADVANEQQVREMMAFCEKTYGRLDVLVCNAGISKFIPFPDLDGATKEVWDELYQVNVEGMFFCAREASKLMHKNGGGNIVTISSQAGLRAFGSAIPYAVSKAAVVHLTECLAMTLAPDIRVNCVSPGVIENTRWNDGRPGYDPDKARVENSRQIPLKRVGQPEDIAQAVVFLASEEASYCTGVNLVVDGGRIQKQG